MCVFVHVYVCAHVRVCMCVFCTGHSMSTGHEDVTFLHVYVCAHVRVCMCVFCTGHSMSTGHEDVTFPENSQHHMADKIMWIKIKLNIVT